MWTGDAELLKTLPQGEAKLATLAVRELVTAPKAKAKVKAKANATAEEERHPEGGKEAKTAAKRPKTIGEILKSGASAHLQPAPHETEGVLKDAGIVDKEEMGQPKPNKRRRIENVLDVEVGVGEHTL